MSGKVIAGLFLNYCGKGSLEKESIRIFLVGRRRNQQWIETCNFAKKTSVVLLRDIIEVNH